MPQILRILCLTLILGFMSACASTAKTEIFETDSGLEKANKVSYNLTDWVDEFFLRPIAKGYEFIVPDPAEKAVARAFDNVEEVTTVANSLLQGKFGQATHDTGRVLANSTLGILGLFEVAESMGLEKNQPEDFGQTLAVWGVGSGPYLYLPFLGPSTLRDAPSRVVDFFFHPINYYYVDQSSTRHAITAVDIIHNRAALLETEKLVSGDRYLFFKDAYLQRRQYLIDDGQLNDELDDFDTDF